MTNRQKEVRKLEEQLSKLIESSNDKSLKKISIATIKVPGITLRDYKSILVDMIANISQVALETENKEEEAVKND